jgi:predicted dehydrogenase
MVFMFTGGRIEVDGWSGSWMNVFGKDGQKIKYPHVPFQNQTPDDNFIEAIQGRCPPAATPTHGILQSELMDAIYESARTGQPARPKQR